MQSPLCLQPKVSLFLGAFFFLIYFISFIIFILADMPLWIHILLSFFIIYHFIYIFRRYVFYQHSFSVKRIWCDEKNSWKIQYRNAEIQIVKLFQSILISRYLILMVFRVPNRFFSISLPLAMDSEDAEKIRLLRRMLNDSPI